MNDLPSALRWASRLFQRFAAGLYDWVLCLVVVAWVFWDELFLHRYLGLSPSAWMNHQICWGCELVRYGAKEGLASWRLDILEELPFGLEALALSAGAFLFARVLRRLLRVTPGEWTFSLRRPPSPPPRLPARLLRIAAGLAALAAVAVLWSLADILWLNPV